MNAYRRPLIPAAVLLIGAALLTACNDGDAGGAETTAADSSPLTVTSTAAPAQETTTTTPDEESEPTDRPLGTPSTEDLERSPEWEEPAPLLTGIRVGEHETFDRVVYDFVGNGEPGWFTGYLDQPYQQGSGHDVEVAGQAFLKIDLTGTTYPFEHDHEGLDVGEYPGGGVIAEVVNTGTFEGHTLTYIGLDEQRPYSVTVLQDPLRVVVDIEK
ncbi:MAG: hypothetical protein Q4G50_06020 [Corynebacterium sp.]|uniref:AMIN-like domain-containing (lipo)protein n=1 Tax=Corynebacterium sp. TaxID=1720 RepID=UPI0026DFEE7E|nr:hypothetical protein [Corynebacterium sp.]MDO5669543.1 hypothetical protein [Corynebacterium sp.]